MQAYEDHFLSISVLLQIFRLCSSPEHIAEKGAVGEERTTAAKKRNPATQQ